ncbi:hypothetical protein IP78_04215 [Brevundimonas sp. AAP58]|nr:hypothetical protein IP78_04215 [Brevundimonas sp. AAP58]
MTRPEYPMRHLLPLCVSLLLVGPVHAQTSQPPPVTTAATPPTPDRTVLFVPQASTACADGPLSAMASDAFTPTVWATTFATPPVGQRIERVAYDFSVSEQGRPLSIRPVVSDGFSRLSVTTDAQMQASFASWVFPQTARQDCRLTLRLTPTLLSSADEMTVLRFYADARPRDALRTAVERRLRRPGDDCGRPPPRTLSYPDYLRPGRPRPGARSWSAVRWDLRDDGTTINVEVIGSSGDAVLDEEARRAVSGSAFRSGAARGCLMTFMRVGPNLAAPPVNRDPPDDPLQRCDEAFASRFTPGPLTYPEALEDRGIEGWARVRFDVATWGQIGNVSVLEVQPAEAFSPVAARIVTSGRAVPSFDPQVRCVVPIQFRLPEDTARPGDGQDGVDAPARPHFGPPPNTAAPAPF